MNKKGKGNSKKMGITSTNKKSNQGGNEAKNKGIHQNKKKNENKMESKVENKTKNQASNNMGNKKKNQMGDQMKSQMESQMKSQMESQMKNKTESQMRNQIKSQIESQIESQMENKIDAEKLFEKGIDNKKDLNEFFKYLNLSYQCFFDKKSSLEKKKKFQSLISLSYYYFKKEEILPMVRIAKKFESPKNKKFLEEELEVEKEKIYYRYAKLLHLNELYSSSSKYLNLCKEKMKKCSEDNANLIKKLEDMISEGLQKEKKNFKQSSQKNYESKKEEKKFVVSKEWYDKLSNGESPGKINNLSLITKKEFWDSKYFELDNEEKYVEIGEEEWNYFESTFKADQKLLIPSNSYNNNIKLLILNPKFLNDQPLNIRPKYLHFDKEDVDYQELQEKIINLVNSKNFTVYQFKEKEKKKISELIFYFSFGQFEDVEVMLKGRSFKKIDKTFSNKKAEGKIYLIVSLYNNEKNAKTQEFKDFFSNDYQATLKALLSQNESIKDVFGLRNLGNTCFLNAGIQCIFHCDLLTKYFKERFYEIEKKKYKFENPRLAEAYYKFVFDHNISSLRYVFISIERKFNNYSQHDSPEMIVDFLNNLSSNLNRAEKKSHKIKLKEKTEKAAWEQFLLRENSIITDLFYGISSTQYMCCNKSIYEPFLVYPLTIFSGCNSCEKLIEKNFSSNAFKTMRCSFCKKPKQFIKNTIKRFPKYLCLLLKRFCIGNYRINKITSNIRINTELRIDDNLYNLFCIDKHYGGSVDSGHYVAQCKVNNTWYEFNDSYSSECSPDTNSGDALLLIYEKQDK